MLKTKKYVPESGTRLFLNGARVYISQFKTVGTVVGYDKSQYLVRYVNNSGILETRFFNADALIEQPTLPYDEGLPF